MNILIVNDDVIAVAGLTAGVDWKCCGIDGEVFIAYNAAQALSILDNHAVEVILCDIEMPGKNGIELIRNVRSRFQDIDCVFLTCHAKFEYAQEAILLGCSNYILAPAPYNTIADAVLAAVGRVTRTRDQRKLLRYGSQWLDEQMENTRQTQGDRRDIEETVLDTENYILANLSSSELSVSGLAKRCNLNDDYLSRLFKKEKGVSLNRFITQNRMELAAQMLKDPKLSISAISIQCGYSNYPHFVTAFKRYYNRKPTEYRKEKRHDSRKLDQLANSFAGLRDKVGN